MLDTLFSGLTYNMLSIFVLTFSTCSAVNFKCRYCSQSFAVLSTRMYRVKKNYWRNVGVNIQVLYSMLHMCVITFFDVYVICLILLLIIVNGVSVEQNYL